MELLSHPRKGAMYMLPMRFLFHDQSLAETALSYWPHDAEQKSFGQRFRISANAVYPYVFQSNLHFLRLSPVVEKSEIMVAAELQFITHLLQSGFPALKPDLALDGENLVAISHQGQQYNVTSFAAVPGRQLSDMDLTPELLAGYGSALAQLHIHSSNFVPGKLRRPDCNNILDWIETSLQHDEEAAGAMAEVSLLRQAFGALPRGVADFGLIHYDFEPDNVFHDTRSGAFHVIDFDDCHYHWYAMDVVGVLAELEDQDGSSAFATDSAKHFLAGYRCLRDLPQELLEAEEIFRRYRALYGFTRVVRCLRDGVPSPQPDWMVSLRQRLNEIKTQRSRYFGQPL